MIKNMMNEIVDFDIDAAKKLEKKLANYLDKNMWKYDCKLFAELIFTTWGYSSALEEIEYLRNKIKNLEYYYDEQY
jgi:hypothetical protein